jgi:hypothetical protein
MNGSQKEQLWIDILQHGIKCGLDVYAAASNADTAVDQFTRKFTLKPEDVQPPTRNPTEDVPF